VIAEPYHPTTLFFQRRLPISVVFLLKSMNIAIYFNNQPRFVTLEIDNVPANRMLATEFATTNLFTSQPLP
jgi:hypothetical protein